MIKLFKTSATMSLPKFFVFYHLPILYFVNLINLSITFPIDYDKEMEKLKDRLRGISPPQEREDRLLRLAIEEREAECEKERQRAERALEKERQKADKYLSKLIKMETQKNSSDHKVKTLEVPLVFRNYANKIEDRFPDVNAGIPKNVKRNQKLHDGILKRKYNWIEILSNDKYSNDVYVQLIKPALKNEFFSLENIPTTKEMKDLSEEEKTKYADFLESFCEGIAVAVDYVNTVIAHRDFGAQPGNDLLNLFERAYDKYVSLFYHAVVGD